MYIHFLLIMFVELLAVIDMLFYYLFLVKNLLEELECLVDDVYGITLTANFSALKVSDSHSIENKLTTESCIIGVEVSVPIFPFTKPLLSVFFSTENTLLFTMMR